MSQMGFFEEPEPQADIQNPSTTLNNDTRSSFFDNADPVMQATMVQVTTEDARLYVDTGKYTVYELADSGDYSVVTDAHQIKDDKFYGYEIF